ncbi:MAG: 30S ribosome-binding factor RbfA, partial [Bythopirellula sp.]
RLAVALTKRAANAGTTMTSRRVQKAAEAIREVVSMAILADLKDPRIEGVTVTYVEVSPDMRNAKVHVSIMGDDTAQRLCLQGLQSSSGYLQQKISRRIDTRYTPRIKFELDMGVKNSIAIAKMLGSVLPTEQPPDSEELPQANPGSSDAP